MGRPLDLKLLIERVQPERQAEALERVLRAWLGRETKVIRGPRLLSRREMKSLVLDNPPMRDLVRTEAAAQGVSEDRVRKKMDREFRTIAANFRWRVILLAHIVLRPLWTKVFSGVDARPEDLERIRAAVRDGTVILVPSHKSHFDYVLMSWVFYDHDLMVPHIVAGQNLAIWPLSILLRGAGAFFIKRSFAGERIFPSVFRRYVRELVRQGYPVEFFIEGGRTRSGKLLPPRLGVLDMVLEAAQHRRPGTEVTLLPIALAYEQVAEEGTYARELGGEAKEKESLAQLARARKVLFRRFGRVYLRVGEPLPCSPLVDESSDQPEWSDRTEEDRRHQLDRVGSRVVHRIGLSMVVLPTALVSLGLLAHHRRGIVHGELMDRIKRFRVVLHEQGALEGAALEHFGHGIAQALDRFANEGHVKPLEHEGERVWAIEPDRRITLDFYKNQVLHFFAPAALAAAALRGATDRAGTVDGLLPTFVRLRELLRREFIFDPDNTNADLLRSGLETLTRHGALVVEDGGVYRVSDPARIGEVHALVRPILEAYALLPRSGARIGGVPADRDKLIRSLQDDGPDLLATGMVTRPEALSLVTLKNALRVLEEDGVLVVDNQTAVTVDDEARDTLLTWLRPVVDA